MIANGMILQDIIQPNVLTLSIYVLGDEMTWGEGNRPGAKRLGEEKLWGQNVSEPNFQTILQQTFMKKLT